MSYSILFTSNFSPLLYRICFAHSYDTSASKIIIETAYLPHHTVHSYILVIHGSSLQDPLCVIYHCAAIMCTTLIELGIPTQEPVRTNLECTIMMFNIVYTCVSIWPLITIRF